jgi:hypothetical protein
VTLSLLIAIDIALGNVFWRHLSSQSVRPGTLVDKTGLVDPVRTVLLDACNA